MSVGSKEQTKRTNRLALEKGLPRRPQMIKPLKRKPFERNVAARVKATAAAE
jgi:hypothetical protein